MEEIRALEKSEAEDFVRIVGMAYPRLEIQAPEAKEKWLQRIREAIEHDATSSFQGCFRDGKLVGVMKWRDFMTNVHGKRLLTGGIGTVAVDLLHKKEKVAKSMMTRFLHAYRERGVSLVSLYPFRVDFYRQMGFGAGTKMNEYRVHPLSLPRGNKRDVVALTSEDRQGILDCYNRYAARTHGMTEKTERELQLMLDRPDSHFFGFRRDGLLSGYLMLEFQQVSKDNASIHDIHVRDLVYETREALSALLAFLRSQADQVRRIAFYTQEEDFHVLLTDPRNDSDRLIPFYYHESHATGVGLMYRIIDVGAYFRQLAGQKIGQGSCTLTFHVRDSFLPENEGAYTVRFCDGVPELIEHPGSSVEADAAVTMDISDFSSLAMGSVRFRSLYTYGLADLSHDGHLDLIDRLFDIAQKPRCTAAF
ncbi:GNAT family N-acetyltransferase [Brevibacillus ruminantium]|uniref:GNAT family N-acetyltransferase n=1 Tax=Brevibacillus ruminantium TaxID=2950604 RepID=A0ABY4WBV4_9BACL|nr:GNAT family N-acetyltransferase [Brevibacillus ruminantium]USG64321.1 GNAT family N-acetyltransferase [Brevibacillus ruminantium]